ncbi:hypothetical protein RHDC4_00022 [Rhodocyclaceae bacterium]|nr:hypothetical protein RHDC4_00022 [Rhodocyclaceae bacterium]
MKPHPIDEARLQGHVDDRLTPEARAEVDAYLQERPDEALRLEDYRAQKQAMDELFAPVLDEPVPDRLVAAAGGTRAIAPAPARPGPWSLLRLAAGLAAISVAGLAGWIARGELAPAAVPVAAASLPRQAAVAHAVFTPDVRRPVEIGADQEAQLVTWLSKRLGVPVRPPKLGALGFELIGGRLLPGGSGPVALFMYQDASGQRLTLYVSTENAANRDTAFRFAQEGAVNVFYWIDGRFGYALSASVGKAELGRIAGAVYEQLDPGQP